MKTVKMVFAALLVAFSTVAFGQTATLQVGENEVQKLKQGAFAKADEDKGLAFGAAKEDGVVILSVLFSPNQCKVGKLGLGDKIQVFFAGNNPYGMEKILRGTLNISKKTGNKITGTFEGNSEEGDVIKGSFTDIVLEELK